MVESVSSSTAAEVATTVRQQPQARPAEEARSRPAERKEAEPPPPKEETKVTLKQAEPQPNTADRNAKPVEQYQNVQNASVLR